MEHYPFSSGFWNIKSLKSTVLSLTLVLFLRLPCLKAERFITNLKLFTTNIYNHIQKAITKVICKKEVNVGTLW